ncbi:MAG: transglycosylase SLT domain-containing protein [Elusimicrobia bacterium]|nr:transglycosylase SLT domain-containing protein [Elusimicrobiota bacterium]
MSRAQKPTLFAWVAGVVLFSILCAHAIGPDPGALRESVTKGPLLAQAALPMRGPTAAAFDMGSRIMAAGFGQVMAAPSRFFSIPPRSLVIPKPKPTPAFKYTFNVLLKRPEITDRFDYLILEASLRHGLDPRLVKAVIAAESEFSPQALSPHGARGLMQVLPMTANELGVPGHRLHDPEQGIRAGTAYLAVLYKAAWKKYRLNGVGYKDAPLWVTERIIASYNAGPRALTRNSFMRQTRNYVRKVLLFYGSDVTEFRRGLKPASYAGRPDAQPRVDTLP